MPINVLLDETKTERIEFGLPWLRELKVSPTVKVLLLEEKPATMGWGDFAIFAMLAFAFMRRMMRFDVRGVIRLGVRLVGAVPDDGRVGEGDSRQTDADPTLAGSPDESRGPLAKARAIDKIQVGAAP